jgi:hypothetical protein
MSMNMDDLQQFIDHYREDIDTEVFAVAQAVQHVSKLIASGGDILNRPHLEPALHPEQLEAFLARAIESAQKGRRFEREWQRLQLMLSHVKATWEKEQILFQEALARENDEEMEYFSQIDFALDGYASVTASRAYPDDPPLQASLGNQRVYTAHFLANDLDPP